MIVKNCGGVTMTAFGIVIGAARSVSALEIWPSPLESCHNARPASLLGQIWDRKFRPHPGPLPREMSERKAVRYVSDYRRISQRGEYIEFDGRFDGVSFLVGVDRIKERGG